MAGGTEHQQWKAPIHFYAQVDSLNYLFPILRQSGERWCQFISKSRTTYCTPQRFEQGRCAQLKKGLSGLLKPLTVFISRAHLHLVSEGVREMGKTPDLCKIWCCLDKLRENQLHRFLCSILHDEISVFNTPL